MTQGGGTREEDEGSWGQEFAAEPVLLFTAARNIAVF